MPLPRMTTQRWMLTVASFAIFMAPPRQLLPFLSAWQEHRMYQRLYYDEGRITALKYLEKSEDFMKAQIALSLSDRERKGFVSAQHDRALAVLKLVEEDIDRYGCRGGIDPAIEVKQYLNTFHFRINEEQGCPCLTTPCPLFAIR